MSSLSPPERADVVLRALEGLPAVLLGIVSVPRHPHPHQVAITLLRCSSALSKFAAEKVVGSSAST